MRILKNGKNHDEIPKLKIRRFSYIDKKSMLLFCKVLVM